MSDDGGPGPDPTSPQEQFTVPIPSTPAPQPIPGLVAPTSYPPPYPSTEPAPASAPVASAPLAFVPPADSRQQTQVLPVFEPMRELPSDSRPVEEPPDPLLAQIGAVLFWITVGWWVAVLVRLLGTLVREGAVSTLFIESLGRWPEEAVVAAVISVLAALVLLLGRGSRGRDRLGWSAAALAVITVAVAVWRLLP
jgi:hypothetical protein